MSVDFEREVMYDVIVDGDGLVEIRSTGGYHGEDAIREFTINDIRRIHTVAEAHRGAYQAYKSRGFEDEEKYKSDFDFLVGA